jgi:diguanylate cyclase (GGDEF)-like protein/PAS domain S-box-containing protein
MLDQALCAAMLSGGSRFAVVITDPAGCRLNYNRAAGKLFGLHDGLVGTDLACIFTDRQRQSGLPGSEMRRALNHEGVAETRECRHVSRSGDSWVESELTALFDGAGLHIGFMRIAQDVHERYLNEETMRAHAGTDQLTGLLNRRVFYEKLDQCVVANGRANSFAILHLVDLDLFKHVNDTLGHAAGDEVLRAVAARLRSVTRDSDHIGRLGGDEFAVLQTGAHSLLDGSYLAHKLVASFREPIRLPHHEVFVSVSIGIATAPCDGQSAAELLRKADLALYRVKSDGRDDYRYFTQALDDKAKRHREHIAALREAVHLRQFHLEYQPIVSAGDGSIHRAEALLRCDHKVLKGLPIVEVLDLLRHSGTMPEVSHWIIGQACRDASEWLSQGHAPMRVAVNLCARELSTAGTVQIVEATLREHGLDPESLSVELTEHDLFDIKGAGLQVICALRAMGVAISLDDFGTGFASMEYLTTLPLDVLKLDRSFIVGLPDDAVSAKVVSAIVALAHSLGLRVVAEGVETVRQRDYLVEQACDELQGFLISTPLNAAEFSHFRTRWEPHQHRHWG